MCTHVLKNSQARISALKASNSASDDAITRILNDTCDKLDDTPKEMCHEIVDADLKSFLRSIRKGESPEEACQRAGMCLSVRH